MTYSAALLINTNSRTTWFAKVGWAIISTRLYDSHFFHLHPTEHDFGFKAPSPQPPSPSNGVERRSALPPPPHSKRISRRIDTQGPRLIPFHRTLRSQVPRPNRFLQQHRTVSNRIDPEPNTVPKKPLHPPPLLVGERVERATCCATAWDRRVRDTTVAIVVDAEGVFKGVGFGGGEFDGAGVEGFGCAGAGEGDSCCRGYGCGLV